mgnify:CR=1 FL=1
MAQKNNGVFHYSQGCAPNKKQLITKFLEVFSMNKNIAFLIFVFLVGVFSFQENKPMSIVPVEKPAVLMRVGLAFGGGLATGFVANVLASGASEGVRANLCGGASALSFLGMIHIISSVRTVSLAKPKNNLVALLSIIADGDGIEKKTLAGVALVSGYLAGSVGGCVVHWGAKKIFVGLKNFIKILISRSRGTLKTK